MVLRFFAFFFRSWTYEITRPMECVRMSTIQVFFIVYSLIQRFVIGLQRWAFFLAIFVVFHWWLYTAFSISRLLQIKQNQKEAITITRVQFERIQEAYPKEDSYFYVNGKYIKLKAGNKLDPIISEIKLIRLGKKPLSQRKKTLCFSKRLLSKFRQVKNSIVLDSGRALSPDIFGWPKNPLQMDSKGRKGLSTTRLMTWLRCLGSSPWGHPGVLNRCRLPRCMSEVISVDL